MTLDPRSIPMSTPKNIARLEEIESGRLTNVVRDSENLVGRRIRREFKVGTELFSFGYILRAIESSLPLVGFPYLTGCGMV